MPAIQSLKMTFDALNDFGTFSEGDTLTGKVTLALSKQTTIESLFVKAKGDADVHWTKKNGDHTYTYSAHTRYFKLKQFLIPEKDIVVPQGTHVFSFSIKIPPGSMPSSFRGSHGKIVYKLEAKLCRSWRMDHTVEKEINFVSKSFPNLQSLMSHQVGSTNKEMGFFSKGNAYMDVTVDRRAYAPGETITIDAKIHNSSTSEMTPKFSLIRDVMYRARGNVKTENTVIHKVAGDCIKTKTQKHVKCAMKIPCDLLQTIQNCDIISMEYHLKVYLDISFAFDPEIIFPVVVVPPIMAGHLYPAGAIGGPSNSDFPPPAVAMGPYQAGAIGGPTNSDFPPPPVAMGPYPGGAIGGPSNGNFPPPPVAMGPYPTSPHSGTYGQPGVQNYSAPPPAYPAHVSGGCNNPVPMASPYGSPFSSSSSSSVLHPPPTAPTFHTPPCAPDINPPPYPPPLNVSPTAPSYNMLPSAPMMNTDFLSQSDEAPPAYSLLFPTSAATKFDPK
ncbi:arrestin domain-containing protein 3 [Dicentrarchus labrax]|uniref:Arrestin C-terminal-like domain-containing protein n=1 Tax=Dicentrarchus labrax TaxID=13489 RepID=A0A8P4KAV1_DICLA|nr:arrestin domain-containing protein 3 [Dicentrarchus labrax]